LLGGGVLGEGGGVVLGVNREGEISYTRELNLRKWDSLSSLFRGDKHGHF